MPAIHFGYIVGGTFLAIMLVVIGVMVYRTTPAGPVQARYDAIAAGMKERCEQATDGSKCAAFAACYREGIEAAVPSDIVAQFTDGERQGVVTPEIETAVTELERACREQAGISE